MALTVAHTRAGLWRLSFPGILGVTSGVPVAPGTLVENPLFDQLHSTVRPRPAKVREAPLHHRGSSGPVRQMNRVAVEGREGKLSPRHTQAELDRLAAKLRDVVDEIRKTAGVPTPLENPARAARGGHPKVVIPKARTRRQRHLDIPPAEPEPPREFYDEANVMLDDLVAKAEAETRSDDESEPERKDDPTKTTRKRVDASAPNRSASAAAFLQKRRDSGRRGQIALPGPVSAHPRRDRSGDAAVRPRESAVSERV